jgi:hypothetical protein
MSARPKTTYAQRRTIAKLSPRFERELERYDAGLETLVVVYRDDEGRAIEHVIAPDGVVSSTRTIDI